MASTSIWQRSISQHQVAHGGDVGGDHVHVDAEAVAEHAARIADAGGGIERVADGQRMQHGAPAAHRMATGGRQHARDLGFGDGAAGKIDVGDEAFAAGATAGERDHNGFDLQAGRAFGDVDGLADHLLRLDQIDDRAGLHAARRGVGEADDAHAVAAPAQHVLWPLRLQPRDHADDLAGADVEAGDHDRAARRHRFHLGREGEAQHGHASPPLRFFLALSAALSAASRAAAAASDSRTVTRSASRRSTLTMSRANNCFERASSTSSRSACSGAYSGSCTSMPPLR